MPMIDISMSLREGMPGFPGDPIFVNRRTHDIERGDPYNLSEIRLSSHAGTHVDPPLHFLPGAAAIDAVPLERLNGPCTVIPVATTATRIGPEEVRAIPPRVERVLFRTRNSDRWGKEGIFFPDYVALTAAGAEAILEQGVRLVGIDSLSIESDPSRRFPVHHLLLQAGALILEGLDLSGAPAGEYDLRCLPLRIHGGDGGPARAVLMPR